MQRPDEICDVFGQPGVIADVLLRGVADRWVVDGHDWPHSEGGADAPYSLDFTPSAGYYKEKYKITIRAVITSFVAGDISRSRGRVPTVRGEGMRKVTRGAADGPTTSRTSRARVLELLRDARHPLGVREIAALLEVHPNTARVHLEELVDAELAVSEQEKLPAPGRPRTVYAAVESGTQVGQRNFSMLSTILTSVVARSVPDAVGVSLEAGRAWGRYLSERPIPYHQVSAEQTLERLQDILQESGFDPGPRGDDETAMQAADAPRALQLRNCPFREVATTHPQIACAIHLGLMQGALEEMDSPLTVDRLDPFVQPTLCVAHISAHS